MSEYYNKEYFDYQHSIGEFGGWANLSKFRNFIKKDDVVVDFGCGGGYLLDNIKCRIKAGIEINPEAQKIAKSKGIEVFDDANSLPDEFADVIISNHALEHTNHPLKELEKLFSKLKKGGRIIFVVPCESISKQYDQDDVNYHLYSWSPMSLGNLFTEAGFEVIESKPYIHKWPPKYRLITKYGGQLIFNLFSKLYARIERSWFQVRIIAKK